MQNSRSIRTLLLRAFLCALAVAGLAVHVDAPAGTGESLSVLADTAVWALAAGAMWLLFGALLQLDRPLRPARLWALAAVFSLVMVLGASFAATGTAELVTGHKARALLAFAGRVPLYFAAMRLLLDGLRAPGTAQAPAPSCGGAAGEAARASEEAGSGQSAAQPPQLQPKRAPSLLSRLTGAPHPSLLYGGLLLLCWLPWYACLFPGTVSNDSITQLKELMGVVPLSNGNPVFQTALVGAFRWLGLLFGSADAGVALYCVAQAVLMAWLLGTALSEMARSAAPRWLWIVSGLFYAFCPIFPVFAFCVGKDTNFAMAVLFFSLMLWRVARMPRGERLPAGRLAGLCLAAALCALLRNAGVFLAALSLGLALLWALVGKRRELWPAPACGLGCVLAVYAALHLAIIPAMNIAPMPETENYSVPLQQVARVAVSGGLTPEQAEAVEAVLPLEEIRSAYNGELSDAVKALWRADATDAQKRAFWRAWRDIVLSNPATALSATFHNTYGYLYPGYMSTIKPTLIIGDQSTRTASVKGLYDYSVNPLSEKLKAFTQCLAKNPLYRAVVAPGLYGWITLFAAACLLARRSRRELLCAVPALFTLAGCLLSAVNGYFRYAMPLYLCAPFLLWLVAMDGREKEK